MIIITIERLKLYSACGGDIDSFSRTGNKNARNIFGDNLEKSWATISSMLQDIELVARRLASREYSCRTIKALNEICDTDSFDILTGKIPFYRDFQSVAAILIEIKNRINTNTNLVWTGFDTKELFLNELNSDIEDIRHCDFTTLDKIKIDFAATSTYQELSISNGWSGVYLAMAESFDQLYNNITENKYPVNSKKPWWRF